MKKNNSLVDPRSVQLYRINNRMGYYTREYAEANGILVLSKLPSTCGDREIAYPVDRISTSAPKNHQLKVNDWTGKVTMYTYGEYNTFRTWEEREAVRVEREAARAAASDKAAAMRALMAKLEDMDAAAIYALVEKI